MLKLKANISQPTLYRQPHLKRTNQILELSAIGPFHFDHQEEHSFEKHYNIFRSSRFRILPVGVRGILSILIISEGIL